VDEPVRLHPNLAAIYRRKVATLQNLLEDDATRSEAVEVIRSLIDQVIFRPTANAGLEVETQQLPAKQRTQSWSRILQAMISFMAVAGHTMPI
jgi:hypothetical protein